MQILVNVVWEPWYHFFTTSCAIIGGVFTVAGIVDSMLYTSLKALKKVGSLLACIGMHVACTQQHTPTSTLGKGQGEDAACGLWDAEEVHEQTRSALAQGSWGARVQGTRATSS